MKAKTRLSIEQSWASPGCTDYCRSKNWTIDMKVYIYICIYIYLPAYTCFQQHDTFCVLYLNFVHHKTPIKGMCCIPIWQNPKYPSTGTCDRLILDLDNACWTYVAFLVVLVLNDRSCSHLAKRLWRHCSNKGESLWIVSLIWISLIRFTRKSKYGSWETPSKEQKKKHLKSHLRHCKV